MTRRTVTTTAVVAGALALAGCAAGPAPTDGPTEAPQYGAITVSAAASLTATFTELTDRFEAAHPGSEVALEFDGSSALVSRIVEGAPVDVFASADEANMQKLVDAGLVDGAPVDFATNVLQIAVAPGNPADIRSFADLTAPDLRVVVCAPQVPCGTAAERLEATSGVTLSPVSEEQSVTDVLGKVTSGEADAGLVYVTDVTGSDGAAEGVDVAEAGEAVNTYPIAQVADAGDPATAAAFIAFVTGAEGRAVLEAAGFGAP